MLVVREVFQAKYGRGDELVALFKEWNAMMQEAAPSLPVGRILTDASGPFFTIVTEYTVENWAAWEAGFREALNDQRMEEWFQRMVPLVESGRRDFYNVVE